MHTTPTRTPTLHRGMDAYTRGGAAVEVIEVAAQRILIRQLLGCVQCRDGRWVDMARLYWVEPWELNAEEDTHPPTAQYLNYFK